MRLLCLALFTAAISLGGGRAFGQEASAATADTGANPGKSTVAGKVLRKGTDEPIHFARVTLTSTAEEGTKWHAVAGTDGKFAIKDVPAGEYQLTVVRNGYVDEAYGARRALDPGVPLTVSAGKPADNLLFRMTPAGVITGHIRDENGEPLPGAHVAALLARFAEGKRTLLPVGGATVNDLGEYRLFGLPPGKYLLSAGFNSNVMVTDGFLNAEGNHEEREGLVTTYYPGTTDPAQAVGVNVEPGAETRSLDFSIQPAGVFHVRGHVLGVTSKDSRFGGAVMLKSANSRLTTMMPEKNAAISEKDGSFDIAEVAPGSYEIIAMEFTGETPRMAHKSVEVAAADVDGVELAFQPTLTIAGHLRWEDKSSEANVPLQVTLQGDDASFGGSSAADVQPDGSFELKGVTSDAYWVNITGQAPDAYLKSAYYGSTNAMNEFHPASGSDAALELVVSARGAHIQGTVMNSDSLPVAGVWVSLIPEEAKGKDKRLLQAARTGANGKFEFRGVAPGTYSLYSWDNVEEHEWDDPEFLKPFKTKSASVTVAEGENKSLDLTLIQTQSEAEARQ
jgi:Carboxypeptidase regulatory-like domain